MPLESNILLASGEYAIIDVDIHEHLSKYKWYLSPYGYAAASSPMVNGKRSTLLMHRVIMDSPKNMATDHINGNRLDNRRYNLRICTSRENHHNRKNTWGKGKYKGVYWLKRRKKWRSQIVVDSKNIHLGLFDIEADAAIAYNAAAKSHFNEFASLNEIII